MSTQHAGLDRQFEVLSHRHRRRLLVVLRDGDPTDAARIDLAEFAEALASDGKANQVWVEMTHCHLPKLESHGYVRWDREAGTVERGPEWSAIEPLLGVLDEYRSDSPDGRG